VITGEWNRNHTGRASDRNSAGSGHNTDGWFV